MVSGANSDNRGTIYSSIFSSVDTQVTKLFVVRARIHTEPNDYMTLRTFHLFLKERARENEREGDEEGEGEEEGEREKENMYRIYNSHAQASLRNIRRRIALTIHKHRVDQWWEEE